MGPFAPGPPVTRLLRSWENLSGESLVWIGVFRSNTNSNTRAHQVALIQLTQLLTGMLAPPQCQALIS